MVSPDHKLRRFSYALAGLTALLGGCTEAYPRSGVELASLSQPLEWIQPVDPLKTATQQAYAQFGTTVALSGSVALVGAPNANVENANSEWVEGAGTATLFRLEAGNWIEKRTLEAPTLLPYAYFGGAVATSNDSVAIAAPYADPNGGLGPVDTTSAGLVYALHGDGADWSGPLQTIADPGQAALRAFGTSVALDNDALLVGIPNDGSLPGQARLFRWDGSQWASEAPLEPPVDVTTGDYFGGAVALQGNTALVGAPRDNAMAGAVYVFVHSGANWLRQQKLVAGDTIAGDGFGKGVALQGSRALVAAPYHAGSQGVVYVFERDETTGTWQEGDPLIAAEPSSSDGFGASVALGKDVAWVGAPNYRSTGAVYQFVLEGGAWTQREPLVLAPELTDAAFGLSVAASGGGALIGAPYLGDASGRVYVVGLSDGSACSADGDCSAGHCTEGVCCNSACDGLCNSCLKARKAGGVDGACGPVSALTNPREAPCVAESATTCGTTGLCDGRGGCALFAKGTECGPASCSGSNAEDPTDTCDGKGACIATPVRSCGALVCSHAACLAHCATSADCDAEKHCDVDGSCQPNRGLSAPCSSAEQCESGFCADGVCCNAACDGQCEACAEARAEGSCIPVSGAPRGNRETCDDGGGETCLARSCDGSVTDACLAYPGEETVCQQPGCQDGQAQPERRCDGQGMCPAVEPAGCGNYACGERACLEECRSDVDCVGGSYCDGKRCISGARCSADNTTAINEVGTAKDCYPYKCDAGACRESCSTENQCAEGDLFCNPDTGHCEPPSSNVLAATRPPHTSSCSVVSGPRRGRAWECLWLLGMIFRWRKRRNRALG